MRYAAVIAAAGLSSRMHEFKPMMCLGEETMIRCVIHGLQSAGVEEIIVVTGYKSALLQKHLEDLPVRCCENIHYAETKMYDSLLLGIKALQEPFDYMFLTPGDVPLVKAETMQAMKDSAAPAVCPTFGNQAGHPVLIRKDLITELLNYTGNDGLRGALKTLSVPLLRVLVDDIGVLMDADTPEDFRALRRCKMENRSGGRLWLDIQTHIMKDDTILTPETAQYIEMIGNTGSIQSACACMHLSYSKGWRLVKRMEKELGYPLIERFPGGSNGGGSALTRKGEALLIAYQRYQEEVRKEATLLFENVFLDGLCT